MRHLEIQAGGPPFIAFIDASDDVIVKSYSLRP